MAGSLTRYDFVKCADSWELQTQGRMIGLSDHKNEALRRDSTVQHILDELSSGQGLVSIHTEIGGIEEERTYPSSRNPRKSPG